MAVTGRVILHIDMDAFYASIEQRDRPELRGRPVIVGAAPGHRGVVCAASYEARRFGVRSAMPSTTAARLCPEGVFVWPRMELYRAQSARIMKILAAGGGVLEPTSIDEAYLELPPEAPGPEEEAGGDLAARDARLQAAVPVARTLKAQIRAETGLTATIGIAANKLLAKLASDFRKPDGLTLIPERDKAVFLRPLPVRALHGVGRVTEEVLNRAGIETIGDLQEYAGDLRALVGSFGPVLRRHAFGEDDRPLDQEETIKSISSEETFERDTADRRILRGSLWRQAGDLARQLERRRLAAYTVQVKLRYGDFTTLTRQLTLEDPITEPARVYRLACFLLGREKLVTRPLRLLGLGVTNLDAPAARQLLLWPEAR